MSDANEEKANGRAARASAERPSRRSREPNPRAHEDEDDDESLLAGSAFNELGERFVERVRERPYAAVATALGAGVLLGSVLSSKVGRIAILAAGGFAVKELFGDRLLEVLEQQGLTGEGEEDVTPAPRSR